MERFYRGKNRHTSLHFATIIFFLAATIRIIRIRIKVCNHKLIVLFFHFFNNFLNIFILVVNIKLSCLSAYRFAEVPLNINLRYFIVSAHNNTPHFYLLTFLFQSYLQVVHSLIYVIMHSQDRFSLCTYVYF